LKESTRKIHVNGALAVSAAALLAACASAPKHNASLEEARTMYLAAANDAQVARSGAIELQKARAALAQAEAALDEGETSSVEHYAYLAKRRTEAAREGANIAAANEAVRSAQTQRQRILIEARTHEAQAQRERAERSLEQAQAQRERAEEARERAEAARKQAELAQQRSAAQRTQAEQARSAAQAAQARADELARQLEELQAKKTDRGMVLTMDDVLFDTGSAVLKPGAQHMLDEVSAFLRHYPERTVMIEGHTDSAGSAEYNQFLSERRAIAVKNALVMRGIEPHRISARGFGESMPVVGNETAAGRQQNRRVDIVLPDLG
jgi:outer membrane protein OmpA-like peptidoglycan-associated protein